MEIKMTEHFKERFHDTPFKYNLLTKIIEGSTVADRIPNFKTILRHKEKEIHHKYLIHSTSNNRYVIVYDYDDNELITIFKDSKQGWIGNWLRNTPIKKRKTFKQYFKANKVELSFGLK